SLTPEPPGAARAHFDRPSGQTLAAPGEPGVAQEVPDRGDDLTPCPLRARSGSEPRRAAVTHGQADTAADLGLGRQRGRPRRPPKQCSGLLRYGALDTGMTLVHHGAQSHAWVRAPGRMDGSWCAAWSRSGV